MAAHRERRGGRGRWRASGFLEGASRPWGRSASQTGALRQHKFAAFADGVPQGCFSCLPAVAAGQEVFPVGFPWRFDAAHLAHHDRRELNWRD